MTAPTHTKNTILKRGDGAGSESFNAVEEMWTITGPDGSLAELDTTNLESTAREFIPGLPDAGNIQCEAGYNHGNVQQVGLKTDMDGQVVRNFTITFPNTAATVWSFAAFVSNWSVGVERDGVSALSFTLRVTGAVTFS